MEITNFEQAVDWLYSRQKYGWKLGLDAMRSLAHRLGNPQEKTSFIHIAGTNGKGSVAALTASICSQAGYKTGLFISPHLYDVRERIRINDQYISKKDFYRLVLRIREPIEQQESTFFEAITLLALCYFAERETDIAVMEVGLGGRLDATNIIHPVLCVITNISLDHTRYLGSSLKEVAGEKAGIIKENVSCLVGFLPEEAEIVIRDRCREKKSDLYFLNEWCQIKNVVQMEDRAFFQLELKSKTNANVEIPLTGEHQIHNACLAATAASLLQNDQNEMWNIRMEPIVNGLRLVKWHARFQIVHRNPVTIIDVAHNPEAIQKLVRLLNYFYPEKDIIFVLGLAKDKDYQSIIDILLTTHCAVQPVAAQMERALSAHFLYEQVKKRHGSCYDPRNVREGTESAFQKAGEQTIICITGSHFIMQEALQAIKSLTN